MRHILAYTLLLVLLAACATGGSVPTSSSVSPTVNSGQTVTLCGHKNVPLSLSKAEDQLSRDHVGIYGPGQWSNGSCGAFIVESVTEINGQNVASVVFVNDKGWQHLSATIYNNQIQFMHNACTVIYQVKAPGSLKGTYYGGRTYETSVSRQGHRA